MKFHDGLVFCHFSGDACLHSRIWKELQVRQNTLIVQVFGRKVERADVSASALQSKYFAGASVMKNVSPCRYYSSTRVAQAEETHSRRQWNDCSQQKRHNVLFGACFLPRGWLLIWFLYSCAVLPINCSFSALKFVSLQDPAYRPLFLKHPDPESQERFVFFSAHFWRNDFLCLGQGQKRCRSRPGTRSHVATLQPSNPYPSYGDMIWVDYDLAYDFDTCPQAM